MTESYAIEALTRRASRYFDRPSFTAPSFLSDNEVVFLDDRSGTKQASVVDLSTKTIKSVTKFTERLLSLKASTKSGRIVYGIDSGGNERQQIFTIPNGESEPVRLTHNDNAIHDPGSMTSDGSYLLYRSNARDESTFDIVGVSTAGGDEAMWLQNGGQVQPVAINEDGTQALVVKLTGNLNGDLLLVEQGKEPVNLTPHEGEQGLGNATFTSDGEHVLFLSNLNQEFTTLRRLNLTTREVEEVFAADNWDVDTFALSKDGKHIAIAVNENGASKMSILNAGGSVSAQVDLPLGVIDQFSWSPDSSTVVFGFSSVQEPSKIMSANLKGETTIVAQADTNPPKTWAPEMITYPTFDGRQIPAYWFKPDGDGPFPVLVDIHGGPESQRTLNYSPSGPVIQYLVSLGIGVLSLNVRGSTGYGKAYSHLDDKERRLDAVADAANAAEWLKQREDVDGDRIAVYGRSYGGFMTLAALVFYPDLWAVGVDVVGIANFVSFLERTGPWRRKHRESEYGELENDREMLKRISPLTHIDNIRVPLMVCHGRNDPRVPLFEAEQVVEAVRSKGLDVVLRIYDDEGHALSKRKNEIDAFVTMGDFLQKHLQLPVQPDL